MAHFAKLNEDNIVTEVIVIPNEALLDENGLEQEHLGIEYCQNLFGKDTKWIQTSYNGNMRFRYAGKGYYYDEVRDVFRTKEPPHPEWIYDELNHVWKPPTSPPTSNDHIGWVWDKDITNWKPIFLNR